MLINKRFLLLLPFLFVFACKYPEKIADGKTAYERKQFAVATKLYEKEFGKTTGREQARIAFFMGKSYEQINDNAKALEWYKKAWDLDYGPGAIKAYAYALKRTEDYDKAIKIFEQLGRETGEIFKYDQEVAICKKADKWLAFPEETGYELKKMDFNSPNSDYAPTFYKDNQLIITSDRSSIDGKEEYKWTGKDFSDLFVVKKEGGVEAFAELNSEYNEGTISFNRTYTTAYFTRCGSDKKDGTDYCKIVFSKKNRDGNWTEPRICSFVKGNYNFAHPYLADDDKTLYFSSDIGNGFGGADIYKVVRTDDGWSKPNNLGGGVNTPKDEKFPFRYKDKLYFASNGHPGMGGLDIFEATKIKGTWRDVRNLRAPVNSGGDDFAYIVREGENDTWEGYLSSTRKDGQGKDDIYYFSKIIIEIAPLPPVDTIISPPPVDTLPEPQEVVYQYILEGKVLAKQYENSEDPNSNVIGNAPLPGAKVSVSFNGGPVGLETDGNGRFTMKLTEEMNYFFLASKDGYFNNSAQLSTKGKKDENKLIQKFTVEIILDPIFKNKEIVLDNIYYDYDKWDIRPDAEPSLNLLVKILNENPSIRIQLSSHTDCRGDDDYNKDLSQKRAQSAVDYLISRGIEPGRMLAQGYGEDTPAVGCSCRQCTEEEHQANRRTTFKVIE